VERLSRSQEDSQLMGPERLLWRAPVVSEVTRRGHACQFAKWRWPAGPPGKDLAGLRRMRHQLRPGGAGQETMEGRMVSKARLEDEQGIHILLFRRATNSKDGIQKTCSQRHRGGTCHSEDPARQSRECFVHKWTFLDSLAVPCLEK
jgi:hypothetical protein